MPYANADVNSCLMANRTIADNADEICTEALLASTTSVDEKSKIYITQAAYYMTKNEFIIANKLLDKAFNSNPKMLENGTYRYNWLRTKAKLYFAQEDYQKALPFFKNAMEVALAVNKSKTIATSYNDLGANYIELNNFTQALLWLNKSLEIHQLNNQKLLTAVSLANIAEVYFITNDTSKSLEYFNKAIALIKQLIQTPGGQNQDREIPLAKIYLSVAKVHLVDKHWDEAFHKLQQALTIYNKYKLKGEQVKVLTSIGEMFLKQSKIDKAMDFLLQAQTIESSLETQDNLDLKQALLDAYIINKDWEKAKKLAVRALDQAIAKENKASQAGFFKSLSEIFEGTGELKTSIEYLKKYQAINKSLLEDRYNKTKIALLSNTEKQESFRELDALEKQKTKQDILLKEQQLYFVLVASLLLLMVSFLIFRLKLRKQNAVQIKRDQNANTQEFNKLTISKGRLKRLFKAVDCPVICFDSTGKIHYASTLEVENTKLKMQDNYVDIWQQTLTNLTDDEQLEKDLYLDKLMVEKYKMVWVHQLKYLDNMLVCLIMTAKTDESNYYANIENIRNYSLLMQKMKDIDDFMQHMSCNDMSKLNHVYMATKSLKLSENKMANSKTSDTNFKRQLVDLMVLCLDVWQHNTSMSIIDLADQSGLWLVSVENGHLRTRTLNRYLDINKIPENPRWLQVIKTAHYVLSNCDVNLNQRQTINQRILEIKELSRNRALGL